MEQFSQKRKGSLLTLRKSRSRNEEVKPLERIASGIKWSEAIPLGESETDIVERNGTMSVSVSRFLARPRKRCS